MTNYSPETREAILNSLGIGGLVTGTLAAFDGADRWALEQEETAKRGYRDWDRFRKQLQPGDVLFHRTHPKVSDVIDLKAMSSPFKESDLLTATKGDPFYHSSIYTGAGKSVEASGMVHGVKSTRVSARHPEELRAYRPKSGQKEALKHAVKSLGRPYADHVEMAKHGLSHLAGIKKPSKCQNIGGSVVCTELAAESYNKILKDKFASPHDMRRSKDLEFIGRYMAPGAEKMGLREKTLSRIVYPVLKNAKFGAAAAGLGLSAFMLNNHMRGES